MRPDPRPALRRAVAALRHLAGMPDYQAYLAHHRTHHPHAPPASEREYFAAFVAARYGDGPTRCC